MPHYHKYEWEGLCIEAKPVGARRLFNWDSPYQLTTRHPGPHCLVANDMSMAPGCQSPLRSPAIVSLDVRIVHHCPWHPRLSALARLSTRKKTILSLSSSSDCLYLFGWHLAG